MLLLLTMINRPDSVSVMETSKKFNEQGGSIGRAAGNFWTLDDPELYLSGSHCQISYENGQYLITDQSTNGTFYNGDSNPMGQGCRQTVNDRDTFIIGDYEFVISMDDSPTEPGGLSQDPFANAAFNDTPLESALELESDTFGGGQVSSSESLFGGVPAETDPLAALDKAQGGRDSLKPANDHSTSVAGPFAEPAHSDQASPLNQQISWPDTVAEKGLPQSNAIPEDWDDDLLPTADPGRGSASVNNPLSSTPLSDPPVFAESVADCDPQAHKLTASVNSQDSNLETADHNRPSGREQLLEKENAALKSELEMLGQQIRKHRSQSKSDNAVDVTLIDAIGFGDKNLVDTEITQINKLAGEIIREMIDSLMQVLGSRSAIKNEFRMNVTTIQPVENNPLKFSANVDDALENMFIKQGNAYIKPVAAVREGFESVADHQLAILAGIRDAFKGVIERFDPVILEQRFAKQKKTGLAPMSRKSRNWDAYVRYYNELADDIDKSFRHLYGDGFVRGYEGQLQKLVIARKGKNPRMDN